MKNQRHAMRRTVDWGVRSQHGDGSTGFSGDRNHGARRKPVDAQPAASALCDVSWQMGDPVPDGTADQVVAGLPATSKNLHQGWTPHGRDHGGAAAMRDGEARFTTARPAKGPGMASKQPCFDLKLNLRQEHVLWWPLGDSDARSLLTLHWVTMAAGYGQQGGLADSGLFADRHQRMRQLHDTGQHTNEFGRGVDRYNHGVFVRRHF